MADFDKIRNYVKISLICQICGFLILVIGFSTPYWRAIHFEYVEESKTEVGLLIQGFDEGLWRRCINSVCAEIDVAGRGKTEILNSRVFRGRGLNYLIFIVVRILLL